MVQVLNMLMNIIRNKVAAVFLGRVGMGMLDMYNKSANLLSQSTNFGIAISGVKQMSEVASEQEMARTRHYATTLRTYSLMVGLFGMSVCILWALRDIPAFASLTMVDAFVLMIAGSFSSIIPVPGGFGAYHTVVAGILSRVWAVPMGTGMVYATLNHESQVLVYAICGLGSYLHNNFFSRKK